MVNQECQAIASRYINSHLKKIVNVYQIQFVDFKAPGFGDYIRGCFCMTQIINILNKYCGTKINFEMDIRNHPMANYIEVPSFDSTIPYPSLGNFHIDIRKIEEDEDLTSFQHILRQIVEYMNKLPMETFYCFCCKYEIFDRIMESDKQHIRSFLRPNTNMTNYIESSLESMGMKAKEYSVLHIRCKDELSFPPRALDHSLLKELDTLVSESIYPEKKYLLLSNHNGIKCHFLKHPSIKIQMAQICHVGQDLNQTNLEVRDTMLDFFLLANSADILALSPYPHGTGFSEECSKLYNIPYRLIKYSGIYY